MRRLTNIGKGMSMLKHENHTYFVIKVAVGEYKIYHSGPRPDLKARKKKGYETYKQVGKVNTYASAKASVNFALNAMLDYNKPIKILGS